eukprot:660239-Pelagomonas_calceolata.AAC.1
MQGLLREIGSPFRQMLKAPETFRVQLGTFGFTFQNQTILVTNHPFAIGMCNKVFRPSHNLPTRSLAEQADIEIADAQRRESSQRAQERARAAHLEALGSDEDEEELKRTRAFDDFKDMHPRGHGNSKLKPCAVKVGTLWSAGAEFEDSSSITQVTVSKAFGQNA